MFQYLQKDNKVGGNTNTLFLAFILNETCPYCFYVFQPISLCNSSYKIMMKIIATKIKNMFLKII